MKQINSGNPNHNQLKKHSNMKFNNEASENKYRISNAHTMTTEELISAMRKKIKEICN